MQRLSWAGFEWARAGAGHRRTIAELHHAATVGHSAGGAQGRLVAVDEAGRRQPFTRRHAESLRVRRVITLIGSSSAECASLLPSRSAMAVCRQRAGARAA